MLHDKGIRDIDIEMGGQRYIDLDNYIFGGRKVIADINCYLLPLPTLYLH